LKNTALMESKYNYDIIRDYLHGVVDVETARKIRELIRTDEVVRNIASGILQLEHEFNGDESEIEAYIERLRERQLKVISEKGKTGKSRMMTPAYIRNAAAVLLIGGSIALLIGLGVGYVLFQSKETRLLTVELETPYPLATTRSADASAAEVAFEHYDYREFEKAIAAFEKVPDSSDDSVAVKFYYGLSCLYAGQYDRAIKLLDSKTLATSRYQEQAEWFTAIALVKNGDEDDAIVILQKISTNQSHFKSREASALLEELE
jgi:tetratricopeptide (TPR) repeat protein